MTDDNNSGSAHIGEVFEGGALARAADLLPGVLPILPLPNRPFFPNQAIPIVVEREPWGRTIEAAMDTAQKAVGVVLVRNDNVAETRAEDFHPVGTACRIHRVVEQDDKLQVLVEGLQRFRIEEWISRERPFAARVQYHPEKTPEASPELKAYALAVITTIKELLPLNPLYGEELKFFLNRLGPEDPGTLADFSASLTTASKEELQAVLEAFAILERLEKVLLLLKKEVEVAKTQAHITRQVEEKISKQQREFFLREQLKVIQKELGLAKDDRTADVEAFRARLKELKPSEQAERRIGEELKKLSVLETGSPEYAVTRNYLDWLTALPWGRTSADQFDLKHARQVLNRDHDGLQDVKDRILEFLAVGVKKGAVGGSILLFVGPPGVGKTSIGQSIAGALGRKFFRFSVGGMRDEAEIKGHRRTYIGAMPGKFIQALKDVGVANPVIMLDEIDKIGAGYQGNPASALLEALDPTQNNEFLDHYLDVRFDLSKVLFICTANQPDTIPGPLLDRMETIRLAGYIGSEKLAIARHHLWPRVLEKSGLKPAQLRIDRTGLSAVIEGYAREAGVRNLEKQLATVARKAVVENLTGTAFPIRVNAKNLHRYLGKPAFRHDRPLAGIGVATGLAWTALGGATLDIEAARVHTHSRGFRQTGQLGEVMKESAEIALSYIAAHCARYKGQKDFFEKAFIHLHVPAGATPKDGPSAGITMATALLSLARGEKPARPLAMTGELTLTGQVLPVGGIREKVIAARRVGLKELILPEANRRDYEELPAHIHRGMKVHFVAHYGDVVRIAF